MTSLNWHLIKFTCGKLLLLESLFMAMSTLVSCFYGWYYGEQDTMALLIPTLLCAFLGWILVTGKRNNTSRVTQREGFFIVTVIWILFSVIGMLPYLIYGTCTQVCDAFLETMSGFTTTGCTVLNNIDEQPHGILLWRSMTQWMGGLGIVVFSLALLPKINNGNVQMFSAEVTGMTVDKLRPKIQATSRRLWFIYVGLTVTCCACYILGGMSVFDGICHGMTTLATGGFSTHQASIGWFHSALIEYICAAFLFIASINFSLFYMVQRGIYRQFWNNEEFRWFVYIVAGFTLIFTIQFLAEPFHETMSADQLEAMPKGFEATIRAAFFHVVTIISTCGFQAESYDYQLWGAAFWLPTLFLMACGGCAGSTAGGVKILRLVILIKNLIATLYYSVVPYSFNVVMLDRRPLHSDFLQRTLAFVFVYFLVSFASITIMMWEGIDLETAIGSTISAIGNCGPGLGMTGPAFTWADLPQLSKWMLSFTMLIGRLEFFTVILLFTKTFWRR